MLASAPIIANPDPIEISSLGLIVSEAIIGFIIISPIVIIGITLTASA